MDRHRADDRGQAANAAQRAAEEGVDERMTPTFKSECLEFLKRCDEEQVRYVVIVFDEDPYRMHAKLSASGFDLAYLGARCLVWSQEPAGRRSGGEFAEF
jgi:hypothetical protein